MNDIKVFHYFFMQTDKLSYDDDTKWRPLNCFQKNLKGTFGKIGSADCDVVKIGQAWVVQYTRTRNKFINFTFLFNKLFYVSATQLKSI